MAYTPNPLDTTQPTGVIAAQAAAAEFRALKTYIATLQSINTTWNPDDKSALLILGTGNLSTAPAAALGVADFASVRATTPKNAGAWYYEVTTSGVAGMAVGVGTGMANLDTAAGTEVYSLSLLSGTGEVIYNGTVIWTFPDPVLPGESVGIGYNPTTGDVLVNAPSGINTFNIPAFIGATLYPLISLTKLSTEITANFGATNFRLGMPGGYSALVNVAYNYNDNANLIVNGACLVDQVNAGAVVNPVVTNTYVIDGWRYFGDVAAKFKAGRDLNAVAKPAGYSNYLGVEVIAAYAPVGTEAFWLEQRIEGYNTVPLAFANAKAAPVTLLFSIYTSRNGVHSGVLTDGGNARVFPFTFPVTFVNTWTQVAITIPGDVAGTWASLTNGTNMKVRFCLGAVTSRKPASTTTWQADVVNSVGASGSVDVVDTLGATFYATGVELRRGYYLASQPRELVSAERLWASCTRYFYRTEAVIAVAGNAAGVGNTAVSHVSFPSLMRDVPAVSTAFAAAVNCTGGTTNLSRAGFDLITTALAAGITTIQYSAGNTFDARL